MTRLASVALREISLPLAEPFRTANGVVETRRIILAELTDADGHAAWSECVAEAAPGYGAETVDGAWRTLSETVVPISLSRSFESPSILHDALRAVARAEPMARACIEMGFWAIEASRREQSLASRLSTSPRRTIECGVVLGMSSTLADLERRAVNAKKDGYRRIKLKISPRRDLELIDAVRAASDDASLAVDANGSYTRQDLNRIDQIDKLGLTMFEQPVAGNAQDYAALQSAMRTPICIDESVAALSDAESFIEARGMRILNIKPGRVGGFTEAVAIHDACAKAGIPVWCGGMLESGIGRAYNVALASMPNFTLPGDISPSARYWNRDIVKSAWTMSADGLMEVPLDVSGLGVEVDRDYVDDLTVRESTLSSR